MKVRFLSGLSAIFTLLFMVLVIFDAKIGRNGAFSGFLLCGRVIIPSLFPFTVLVIFLIKNGILERLKIIENITTSIFCLNYKEFSVLLLSFFGGFPISAKLLNDMVKRKEINPERAGVILCFTVNAGPAFIISAVGIGVFENQEIGLILFIAQILASLFLCFFARFDLKKNLSPKVYKTNYTNITDSFIEATSEASQTIIKISAFVIFFSFINSYILYFAKILPYLKIVSLFLEVTNSVNLTKNIYIITFLLGFAGFCVWFQIFSIADLLKIKFFKFIIFRVLQGALSVLFTKCMLMVFKINVSVFSNISNISAEILYSTPELSISLLFTVMVFVISVFTKKYTGKFSDDVL